MTEPYPSGYPATDSAVPRLGVLLTVAYDGSRFAGFARQPTARTIAGELDGAVRAIDATASTVRGASRTDSGVHALSQRVAFDTSMDIPSRGWVLALAQHTSDEIAIVSAARVPAGYDPRDHARKKTYRYTILRSPLRDPFLRERSWRIGERLNQQLMRDEADALIGRHDFRAFRSSTDARVDTVRTIFAPGSGRTRPTQDFFTSRLRETAFSIAWCASSWGRSWIPAAGAWCPEECEVLSTAAIATNLASPPHLMACVS